MALTTKISLSITAQLSKAVAAVPGLAEIIPKIERAYQWADGGGANQASKLYVAAPSVTAASPLDIDLQGSLTNPFGDAVTFATVKLLYLLAAAANTANLLLGGSSAPVPLFANASDIILVPPGGEFLLTNPAAAGFAVTATSADLIRLDAASGTQAGTIVIIGD